MDLKPDSAQPVMELLLTCRCKGRLDTEAGQQAKVQRCMKTHLCHTVNIPDATLTPVWPVHGILHYVCQPNVHYSEDRAGDGELETLATD